MTSRERFLAALTLKTPDRLPTTTHQVTRYFLDHYMDGISSDEFYERFGIDAVRWVIAHRPDESLRNYYDPNHPKPGYLEPRRVSSDAWRIVMEPMDGFEYRTVRYKFITPKRTLTMILQSNEYTSWVTEHLIKEKSDIDVIGEFVTAPLCDTEEVNRQAEEFGDRGILRTFISCFDVFGQPGCWQDATCLAGTQEMILAAFDDPEWVHALLRILRDRKLAFVRSLLGARYDLLELGGGAASTTVISPNMFEEFVAPYDKPIIDAAHEAGQRIVYHTCGGMMPILEMIADMGVDAMETFTPPGMGGDTDLSEAKRRIGDRVCMIGGFDQFHYFQGGTPEETRTAVRRCFDDAGKGGGYILSPSDHFFDADLNLVQAFADEARECGYDK